MCDLMAGCGLVAILASFIFITKQLPFPGLAALPACLGAAAIIAAGALGRPWVNTGLSHPAFLWVGRRSYSLYLWHWPVLVFVGYYNLGEWTAVRIAGALVLTLAASALSYRFVEQPVRHWRGSGTKVVIGAAVGSLLIIVLGLAIWRTQGVPNRFPGAENILGRAVETGDPLVGVCMLEPNQRLSDWQPDRCRLADGAGTPTLVWGDSYAGHLRHGIQALRTEIASPTYLLSASACPSVFDVDVATRPLCKANNAGIRTLIKRLGVRRVVLASNWDFAISQGMDRDAVRATIAELRAAGLETWVVGQPPAYALVNPQYLAFRLKERGFQEPVFRIAPRNSRNSNDWLSSVVGRANFIDPFRVFCRAEQCDVYRDGALMVVDSSHLSPLGSRVLVADLIARRALR